jgi:hypothetical protein
LGIPMISGVPDNCAAANYGFSSYSHEAKNREMQDHELCRRAQQIGIDRIIKVLSVSTVKNLDCSL